MTLEMADSGELITEDSATDAAVNAIIQAHDGSLPAQERLNEASLRTKVRNAITNLETADASWGALTAAQKDAAIRLSVRVAAKLARLAVAQLEAD